MRFLAILALLCEACGDNASPCDHDEVDDLADGTMAETTGLAIGRSTQLVCGRIEGGHYDSADKIVDVDRYRIDVEGTGGFSVAMAPLEGRNYLTSFAIKVFDTAPNPTLLADGHLDFAYDHGAFAAGVPPGSYDLVMAAGTDGDISGGFVDYRVRVSPDPASQCNAQKKPTYTERDEANNDAVTVNYDAAPIVTAGPGAPEATAITIAPFRRYAVRGTAHPGAQRGEYSDTDVFALRTATDTNELTVRLDWDVPADLDYLVVEAETLLPAGIGVLSGDGPLELATFPVKPDTSYLLIVGADTDASYTATLCSDRVSF